MVLKVINHPYAYDMKKLCTVFFPFEKIRDDGEEDITVTTADMGGRFVAEASAYGKTVKKEYEPKQDEDMANAMSVLLFSALSELTGYTPEWGILFGVRPAKLMHRYFAELGENGAKNTFINKYLVSPKKAELTAEVMKNENRIISLSKDDSFSLYISIPFCPTRCAYCSFVSHSIERTQKLVEPYVDLLCKEIERTAEVAKKLNLRLETVYFGGGTPTTLTAEQLDRLMSAVENNFDLSTVREYTVEAGRPDTVTESKLLALKKHNVSRISINPQTFNDTVLEAIGRKHTAAQTVEAFELARKCGFDNINMDIIAGLPTDTPESFGKTLDKAVSLGADSITVHTLALKTASNIVTGEEPFEFNISVSGMVDYSDSALKAAGYVPYYMYRQSKSAANLENVGWCNAGRECLYNVYMMDETHSVFACGAGAVTRLRNPENGFIDRIYNFKYPYEYIDNFDEVIERKEKIFEFYNGNNE